MRDPRIGVWSVALGCFLSLMPAAGAASKSQAIQVLIYIPERPADPSSASEGLPFPDPEGQRPPLGALTTTWRDGRLLYTYTESN